MKASYIRLVFLVAAYLQWAPLLCQAQDEIPNAVTSQNRSGELPFSTRIGTDVEHADVSSGNLTVTIAITSLRGRGQNFSFSLRYDARILVAGVRLDPNTGRNYLIWNLEGGPWGINAPSVTSGTHQIVCNPDFGLVANLELGVISTDPNGSKHTLAYQWDDGTQGVCGGIQDTNGPDLTGQGMLATLGASDPEIILSNGTIVTTAGNWTDPNGNQKSEPLGQDTLGRTIVTKQNNGASQILYKIYDSNGVLQTYTVNYTNISIATHFNLPDPWGGTIHELTATRQVVSSIVLPNGRSYQFQYENGSYGGLTRIDLPTGAYVTYTWATLVDNLKAYRSYRYVASRTVNVNGQSSTWNIVSTGNVHALTTTVTDPLSNQTVYLSDSGAVSSAKFYQGAASGTPLRQYAMSYAADDDPQYNEFSSRDPTYEPQEVALRLTGITTTLDNGLVSKKEFDYDTLSYTYHTCIDYPCAGGAPSTFTTSRGNVTEMREYAYAVGAPGPLVRRTTKAYLHDSNPGYLAYNIVDKVIQENVYDSTANTCQGLSQPCVQAVYEYDNYVAGDNPLLATSNAAQHDYTGHGASFTSRGNATRVKHWRNTDGALLTITYQYDDLGNIRAIKDPLGHTTSYSYTDNWANGACLPPAGKNGQAFVYQVTNALGQITQLSHYPCSSLVQARKDQNDINASRAGTTYAYDLLGRPTQKNTPEGGQVATTYNDIPPVSATTTTKINATQNLITAIIEDGLGRTTQSQTTSGPLGTVSTDTAYDALGRVHSVSNPHVSGSSPTDGITTYVYDALGRTCVVVPPDGTAVSGNSCPVSAPSNDVSTTYAGNSTTVADQVGKSRKSVSDALGRLTQVFEDPSGLNYETDYQYDILGNLLCAVQKGTDSTAFTTCAAAPTTWRPRSFTYNSLSQLTQAVNPESGTATYTYNSDGTLATKVSPAPNQTGAATVTATFVYDQLHRVTQKSFSDTTPTVKYGYDSVAPTGCTLPTLTISNGIGKRTGMCDAAGAEAWSYDITSGVGWNITDARTTNSVTKSTIVQNNLVGSPAILTYPSGRIITYAFDAAARPISAIDSTGPINYATAAAYAPTGALSSLTNGPSILSTLFYNNRLQPCRISVKNTGTAPASCTDATVGNVLDFAYCFNSNMSDADRAAHYCAASATLNNGNVAQIVNKQTTARTQNFKFDSLNRIQSAYTEATTAQYCWDESMGYDAWGNLLTIGRISGYTCSNEELLNTSATNKNQISGDTYDAAGNLITIPAIASYTFDAENHLKTAAGVTYTYDGDGKRIQKSSGKLYWYGMGTDPLDETDAAGNTNNASFFEYAFFGGKRIARRDSTNAVNYYFADHLGTARIVANSSGTPVDDSDFYPFGGERPILTSSGNRYKFTAKERDSESGLDNFGARYNSSSTGRFISADPKHVSAHLSDPQTFDRYTYARNNPLFYVDPDGKDLKLAPGLTASQTNQAVSLLAQQFQKPNQRAIILSAVKSPVKNTISTAPIPQEPGNINPGDNIVKVGFTNGKPDPAKTTNEIHLDPALIDYLGGGDWVAKHELSHTKDVNQNLAGLVEDNNNSLKNGTLSKTEQDARAAQKAPDEPPDISIEDAENAVRSLLDLPMNPVPPFAEMPAIQPQFAIVPMIDPDD